MGIDPWIGYGLWYVADQQGFFADEGLDVELVEFNDPDKEEAAFASGDLDVMSQILNRTVRMASSGIPVQIVLMEDSSVGADGIVATGDLESPADLAGATVGMIEGTAQSILVQGALDQAGLSLDDINASRVSQDQVGALANGSIDALATYEPYLSRLQQASDDYQVIYDTSEDPGLISDGLVAQADVAESKPGALAALVRAWLNSVDYYEANPRAAQEIMAENLGLSQQGLAETFETIQYYGAKDQEELFLQGGLEELTSRLVDYGREEGTIQGDIEVADLINPAFVEAAISNGN